MAVTLLPGRASRPSPLAGLAVWPQGAAFSLSCAHSFIQGLVKFLRKLEILMEIALHFNTELSLSGIQYVYVLFEVL